MYWNYYTRERAALEILDVSHRLSQRAWIFRPLDDQVRQQAVEALSSAREELLNLGYAPRSKVLVTLDHVLSTLNTFSPTDPPPFNILIDLSQGLLSTVKALSISSSPFPIPNRHLPPEILHNIYDYVVLEQDPVERQDAIFALSATSTLWRRIVEERPVAYFSSTTKLELYQDDQDSLRDSGVIRLHDWEEVHIDLSEEDDAFSVFGEWWDELFLRFIEMRRTDKQKRHTGRLVLALPMDDDWPVRNWAGRVTKTTDSWGRVLLAIPNLKRHEYLELWRLLFVGNIGIKEERSYHLGSPNEPILLWTRTTQAILDKAMETRRESNGEAGRVPVFLNYTVFAAPWLVFTAPIFLLETVPEEDRPTPLPPSRLRHLEISFQIDPSNPAQAIQEIESFFTTIAPRIERLVFRLRSTGPHPSAFEESKFTVHLVSCLVSCTRLRHLSIGGFGFAPDLLSRLSLLPLRSLTILPLQYVKDYNDYLPLLHASPPDQTRKNLSGVRFNTSPDDPIAYSAFADSWRIETGDKFVCENFHYETNKWRELANAANVKWI
ncbi:hypothetical protein JCM5350_000019 [Sporobolomyces pararoseus]